MSKRFQVPFKKGELTKPIAPNQFCGALVIDLDTGAVGLRPLVGSISIDKLLSSLAALEVEITKQSKIAVAQNTEKKEEPNHNGNGEVK